MSGYGIPGRELAKIAALHPTDCPYCQAAPEIPCMAHRDVVCTGIAASWCPIHGDCICPRSEDGGEVLWHYEPGNVMYLGIIMHSPTAKIVTHYDPACPLHAVESLHAEEL